MTPIEERIRLLLTSYGLEGLIEMLDIEEDEVIKALIENGDITERDLYEI